MAVVKSKSLLRIIDPRTDPRWDRFVEAHPQGSLYHHSAWIELIQSSYRYSSCCVAAESPQTGELRGILPFLRVDSRLTGRRIVSLPFTSYCPPLMPDFQISEVIDFVRDHEPDVDFVEVRNFSAETRARGSQMGRDESYVTHILDLDRPLPELFAAFHSTSVRQRIRRAERNGLKFRWGRGRADLEEFYRLETCVRRKHGLPPQPFRFFANMWKLLRPRGWCCLPVVEYEGRVIAAATVLKFKNTAYLEYSASDPSFLSLSPNQKLIWETIRAVHRQGIRHFDFGRSPRGHSSLISFKERWGATPRKLVYRTSPGYRRLNTQGGLLHGLLTAVNRHLPSFLIQLEGALFYHHLG